MSGLPWLEDHPGLRQPSCPTCGELVRELVRPWLVEHGDGSFSLPSDPSTAVLRPCGHKVQLVPKERDA